jgi:pyrimidine-nucleoside phosphorylase
MAQRKKSRTRLNPVELIIRKRDGGRLDGGEIRALVDGFVAGEVADYQMSAWLMAAFLRGLDDAETVALTDAMLHSGDVLTLASVKAPRVDKHSTGGVGDKVSICLAPLVAACGVAVPMISGRGLGHTGGTLDKLEAIPGYRVDLDAKRFEQVVRQVGTCMIGQTDRLAPADRRIYALRDVTGTVECIPLIVASILSKKLASGAAAIVFDVKTGNGAFLAEPEAADELARQLVFVSTDLGTRASALVTDMSQPLGDWVGHAAEVREALDCLGGAGPEETVELTARLAAELGDLLGVDLSAERVREVLRSGRAREVFARWAVAQGAEAAWFERPLLPLAPVERVIEARRSGVLAMVAARQLGLLLGEAGGSRKAVGADLDRGVALRYVARLGRRVEAGEEIARVYLRRDDGGLVERFAACFRIADEGEAPPLVHKRVVA